MLWFFVQLTKFIKSVNTISRIFILKSNYMYACRNTTDVNLGSHYEL